MLEEIEEERQRSKAEKAIEGSSECAGEEVEDVVLVACKDERMCLQLQEVVHYGPEKVMTTVDFTYFMPLFSDEYCQY